MSGFGEMAPEGKKRTDVAPDWRWIANVTCPDDGVDEINQVTEKSPKDVEQRPRVSCFDVPWSREENEKER
jgi:hypothetical protein